jgi:hypothetical protein
MVGLPDVAQQIKDGILGVLETVRIGEITLSALEGLSGSDTLIPTRKPIAANYDMTDAAVKEPTERALTILLADPEYSAESGLTALLTGDLAGLTESWRDKRDLLYQYQKFRTLVDYQTHENVYPPSLVVDISPIWDVSENQDAFMAVVTMFEIVTNIEEKGTGLNDSPLEDDGIF